MGLSPRQRDFEERLISLLNRTRSRTTGVLYAYFMLDSMTYQEQHRVHRRICYALASAARRGHLKPVRLGPQRVRWESR